MALPFDHIANRYDSAFSRSAIGQLQRKCVWSYMEKVMPDLHGFEMLELNHGTDEDSDLFADGGSNVLATDITFEMLKLTNRKNEQFSMQNRISSHFLDIETFDETLFDKKFDLVFSNFGGLNRINPESLRLLFQKLPKILNPGGRFIGVIMPRMYVWQIFFFMLRFRFRRAFERWTSKEVQAEHQGVRSSTWYYRPSEIKKWSEEKFRVVGLKPVGLVLPPAYLDNFFNLHKRLLLQLNSFEKRLSNASVLPGFADHFIIDLKLT